MINKDGILTYRQSKTGAPVYVPWTAKLPDWASHVGPGRRQMLAATAGGGFTFLETKMGRARTPKGLSHLISAAARKAGLTRNAHGMRKSRMITIAEAGESTHAIMGWSSHESLSEAEHYTRAANKKRE